LNAATLGHQRTVREESISIGACLRTSCCVS
jgi:hypothetical protein